jgi:glycine dehydrogenase subunit 2
MSKLIFEIGKKGHSGLPLPPIDVREEQMNIPQDYLRAEAAELPEVSEPELIRHYTLLSQKNFCVDTHYYPLGSCTMKYNPRINEDVARLPGLSNLHPLSDLNQGALQVIYELEQDLKEIFGFDAFTLQPAAGAHGELTSLMMVKAYFQSRKEARDTVLVPETAHGTNPASASMCGFQVIEIASNEEGNIDINDLKSKLNDKVAALMITNPNTLGLFERNIMEIADLVHQAGAVLYGDGANSNALLGVARPGDLGFDLMHVNLHKTFSTPHGGGGPGSGPVGVKKQFIPFLPRPIVIYKDSAYQLDFDRPQSIGKIKGFYGNFGVMIRALAYIKANGPEGLKNVTEQAVLSANYLKEKLKKYWQLAYNRSCMHEFVLSGEQLEKETGVKTIDVAKRLLDYGYHAPTVYFPMTVKECLMIEPTETENLDTLNAFAEAMIKIYQESHENPDIVKNAPHKTPVSRFDEVKAARNPILKYSSINASESK